MKRRQFVVASSAAAGAVLFAGCVPPQREMTAESRPLMAEDVLSAYDTWYATTCRGCDAACGVVVRVVDGRARKVEGNPNHPLNRGKLCARGQALVQEEYHPDRIRGPLRGKAAAGRTSLGWDEGITLLVSRLRNLAQQGRAGDVSLITPPLGGHRALVVERFARAYGLKWLPFEPLSEGPLREAARRVFGTDRLPRFDLQHARTVLSFGADFLGGWLSPVRFGLEYGIFRQGSYDARAFQPRPDAQPRGRLIHVDTHFSATAASADEWVWVRPGAEGLLAMSFAQALGGQGLEASAPEQTAARTGVAAERVRRIAAELRQGSPSLVIGGGSAGAYTQGTETLSAILSLNLLLGNVGQPGGVLPPAPAPLPDLPSRSAARPLRDWQDLVARMRDGREQAVLVLGGANPVHGLPGALGFGGALASVPFVVSLASFDDDTTRLADLVLPASLPLEDWGAAVPESNVAFPTLSVQQPVVQALFDTRGAFDVLLVVADELGGATRAALSWPTFRDVLRDGASGLRQLGQAAGAEQFWTQLLQHGGWWDPDAPAASPLSASGAAVPASLPDPEFDGDSGTYPFVLAPFAHNTLGAGQTAHLPWLQAAPDPITSVTWQSWVEINAGVAARLGVAEGDMLAVESPRGRVEVPAYISPAAPPEVLAMPLGQGHAGFGRWANGRGANPLALVAPLADTATGALAYGSTRVRLSKTGRRMPLPKFEGSAPARQLPGQEVLQVTHAS